jgi:hypothetical protein
MGSTATDLSLKQTYDKTRELSQQAIQIIPNTGTQETGVIIAEHSA